MNNGIRTESVSHINPDYTDMVDLDFWADDNGDGGYKINGESVSVDLFDEMIEKAAKSEKGNKCLIVNYEDMLPYYPYVCDPDLIDAFDMMYRELLDPDYEKFSGYYNDNMRKLEGNWSLIRSEVHAKDTNFEYDSKTAENGKGYETLSALTFSKENGAGMWLSTYKDGNSVDDLTITSYAMPYTYMNSGISEGLDFGWSVKLDPEFSDWEFYMCMDDEDHLILALFKDSGYVDGDYHPIYYTVVLTYERGTDPEDL